MQGTHNISVERTWSEMAFIADDARFYDNELEKRPYI